MRTDGEVMEEVRESHRGMVDGCRCTMDYSGPPALYQRKMVVRQKYSKPHGV